MFLISYNVISTYIEYLAYKSWLSRGRLIYSYWHKNWDYGVNRYPLKY